jgi:hypothetical protein
LSPWFEFWNIHHEGHEGHEGHEVFLSIWDVHPSRQLVERAALENHSFFFMPFVSFVVNLFSPSAPTHL